MEQMIKTKTRIQSDLSFLHQLLVVILREQHNVLLTHITTNAKQNMWSANDKGS